MTIEQEMELWDVNFLLENNIVFWPQIDEVYEFFDDKKINAFPREKVCKIKRYYEDNYERLKILHENWVKKNLELFEEMYNKKYKTYKSHGNI